METIALKPPAIRSFHDLIVWKEGHVLVLAIYKETTLFPGTETFGLVSQLRRAAVSVTSNIAEGFRKRSRKEKQKFYCIAMGSLTEIQNQLLIAHDVGYLPKQSFNYLIEQTIKTERILTGLIRSAQTQPYP